MCKNSGFRSRIQKSYKKFGIESKNLIIFSESIPNLLPPPIASLGSHRFNEIQQEDYLWKFVLIYGFKASHKFSRIICGLNGLFLNNFT